MRNRLVTVLSLSALVTAGTLAMGAAARAQDTTAAAATPAPGVTVTGSVETYFTYNFNRPEDKRNSFIYNNRHSEFGVNYVGVTIAKAATPTSRTGFTIRLIEGDVKRLTLNAADFEDTENLLEAYGTMLVPFGGRDAKIDAGQFVTHVGYETIDIGTNNFFSRALLFQIPPPFYNAGVRAALPIGPNTTFTGFLLNQYNGRSGDPYDDIAPGFQLAHTLSPTSSIVLNGLTSREPVAVEVAASTLASRQVEEFVGKQLSIIDLIYSNQFNPTTRFVLEALYRTWEDTEDQYGVAGYLMFSQGGGNVLGLRAEYLNISPDGAEDRDQSELTLSYDIRSALLPGARTLLELRFDNASDAIFLGRNGAKKNQTAFTIGQVFSF